MTHIYNMSDVTKVFDNEMDRRTLAAKQSQLKETSKQKVQRPRADPDSKLPFDPRSQQAL